MRAVVLALFMSVLVPAVAFTEPTQPAKWEAGPNPWTRIGRDKHGRVVAVDLGHGRVIQTEYEEGSSRRLKQKSADGSVIVYRYDSRGRVETISEADVQERLLLDENGDVAAKVYGKSAAQLRAARGTLELPIDIYGRLQASKVTYEAGKARGAQLGALNIAYEHLPDSLLTRVSRDRWSFSVKQSSSGGGLLQDDSYGTRFTVTPASLASDGQVIASCSYDSEGRPESIRFPGGSLVYSYDEHGQWDAKSLVGSDGSVIGVFPRRDYPDPDMAVVPRGQWIAPTGDVARTLAGTQSGYRVESAVAVALDDAGRAAYYAFSFQSRVAYSDDEIRLFPDGTLEILPAMPHGEMTAVQRTVKPIHLRLANAWRGINARGVSVGERQIASQRAVTQFGMGVGYFCIWVPDAYTWIDDGTPVTPSRSPGYYDCEYRQFYYEDEPPPPSGGSGGGGAYVPPLSTALQTALTNSKSEAESRLLNCTNCSTLFDPYGNSGADIIRATTYRDGSNTSGCTDHPQNRAYTTAGSLTVYLCGDRFTSLSTGGAAIILIHEALHSSGLDEYPNCSTCMTSEQITDWVASSCGGL